MRLEEAALQNWSCGCESKKKKLTKGPKTSLHGPTIWRVNISDINLCEYLITA